MVTLLLIVVLFACVALIYNDGMWSNAIRLVNVITAALLATNFFEPLANFLDQQQPSYTYFWDFLSLWGLFMIFSVIFRVLTGRLSQVKVKFLKLADRIGSGILSLWIGWVIVCFTLVSLHVAPLARNSIGGSFKPEQAMFSLGFIELAPDRQWLGFTQKMSIDTYSKTQPTIFDPNGEFLPKYATRRANLESNVQKDNSLRTASGT